MRFEVVHQLPGRVRLRIPELRTGSGAASLTRWLTPIADISDFRLNPFCSSAVIYTDENSPAAWVRFERTLLAADWQAIEAAPAHTTCCEGSIAKLGRPVLPKGQTKPF